MRPGGSGYNGGQYLERLIRSNPDIRDVTILYGGEDQTQPMGPEIHPALVLCAGSVPTERNSTINEDAQTSH